MFAVNPKTVRDVEVDGVKFKVGIIPYGVRLEIESSAYFNKDAKTIEQVQNLLRQSYDYVRWSVKGHSGLKYEDGTEVPFKSVKEKINDVEYDVVAPEVMEIYAVSGEMLAKLTQEISKTNYLKEQEVKN